MRFDVVWQQVCFCFVASAGDASFPSGWQDGEHLRHRHFMSIGAPAYLGQTDLVRAAWRWTPTHETGWSEVNQLALQLQHGQEERPLDEECWQTAVSDVARDCASDLKNSWKDMESIFWFN